MGSNIHLSRVRFTALALFVATVMTAAVMVAFLGQARATDQAGVALPAPAVMTYKSYLPLVTARKDTIYGIEMTAVSDGAGLALMRCT